MIEIGPLTEFSRDEFSIVSILNFNSFTLF